MEEEFNTEDYVEFKYHDRDNVFCKILDYKKDRKEVRVLNLHNGVKMVLNADNMKPIFTTALHLKRLGFEKEALYTEISQESTQDGRFVLGAIEIINFAFDAKEENSSIYIKVRYGYTPVTFPLDVVKLKEKFFQNDCGKSEKFQKEYPRLRNLNTLFRYLDSQGIKGYDKVALVLADS